jgi:hypothetical protein
MNQIFYNFDAYFDPEDQQNGSLYIFKRRGSNADETRAISLLVEAKLWSKGAYSMVRDDQREAYATQLEELEVVSITEDLLLGRYDHPKFRSDATRWENWVSCLKSNFGHP